VHVRRASLLRCDDNDANNACMMVAQCCRHIVSFERACNACKTRADEVEQFEQVLAQNVSEAPRTFEQFTSEHAAAAQQYAVRVKRAIANILLASQSGWALRAMTKLFLCACSALDLHCLVSSVQRINSARVGHIVRHGVCKVVKNIASAVRLCVKTSHKLCVRFVRLPPARGD
jgi:hypothetical protein